jgi:hypothetical protein
VLGPQRRKNGNSMKKIASKKPEMPKEYDFSTATVGKYAERYANGTNVVVIDRDLTRKFPDSKSVNAALRRLVEVAAQNQRSSSKSRLSSKGAR